jgi:DNA-binding response OmpR family regulator
MAIWFGLYTTANNLTSNANRTMNIVIIDDDAAIREVTTLLFEQQKWKVSAYERFSSLEQLKQQQPDIFLLDYWMAGLSGTELISTLRNDPDLAKIPIIIMSAMQHVEQELKGASINKLIKKPFDIDELVSVATTLAKEKTSVT